MSVTISGLYSYPVKSCAGIAHTHSVLTPGGLPLDRHWMVVDQEGIFLTQRTCPRMVVIQPTLDAERLLLNAPSMPSLDLPLSIAQSNLQPVPVRIFRSETTGFDQGDEAAQWFSRFLDISCRLLRVHPDAGRLANPKYVDAWIEKNEDWAAGFPASHRFGFADGFPLLVANQASLDDINQRLAAKRQPGIAIDRFRPNIVLQGLEPYDEDYLSGMSMDGLTFAFVKPCGRCPIPNVDPQTGLCADEPGLTLAEHRSFKEGVLFAVNAVVAVTGSGAIGLGDSAEPEFSI